MVIMWKPLKNDIISRIDSDGEKIDFIRILCTYDIILIPVTYILGVWRGYEYLYIARLMLWAEIIMLIKKRLPTGKRMFSIMVFVVFVGWMVFRQYNTWEDSGLMPYIFEPLYKVFGSY